MDGSVIIGTELDTKSFEAQIAKLEDELDTLSQEYEAALEDKGFPEDELKKYASEIEQTKNKLISLKEKQDELNQSQLSNISDKMSNIGNKVEGVIKKVVRWGLAIIGVRSAYSAVRQAISLVSGQNEEVANKIQQMRNVLAGALLPIVQQIINFLAKLMVYINYIFKVLTGKNLFNFSDATKKTANNLKSGAGSSGKIADNLKEARKQLAGFDEMNVLNDNVQATGGGGAGGVGDVATDFDNIFDSLKNIQIPKWIKDLAKILKTIKKHWKEIITVVAAFGAAILALKLTNLIVGLLKLEAVSMAVKAGIGLMVAGFVLLVGAIANAVLNWDKMTKKEKIITTMLGVVGAAFITLGYAIATGISVATLGIGALIAAIIALTTATTTSIIKEYEEVKAVRDVALQEEKLKKAKEDVKEAYDNLINAIDRQTQAQKDLIQAQDETGLSGEQLYKQVEEGTITYKQMTEEQRRVYKAYKELTEATKEVDEAEKNKTTTDKEEVKQALKVQGASAKTKEDYEKLKDAVLKANKEQGLSAKDCAEVLTEAMGKMDAETSRTFQKDIPESIRSGLEPGKYRTTWEKFVDLWNYHMKRLITNINIDINSRFQSGGGKHAAKGAIVTYPKLGIGGIVNRPGIGVPIGGAITGERGAEGVIPLTDSQQMALLGEAIGRYITINANITNTMNGRVISRELQKVQNDSDFAYNR